MIMYITISRIILSYKKQTITKLKCLEYQPVKLTRFHGRRFYPKTIYVSLHLRI